MVRIGSTLLWNVEGKHDFMRVVATCGWIICSLYFEETDRYKNPGRQADVGTKFCTVSLNMCGSFVENLLRVVLWDGS